LLQYLTYLERKQTQKQNILICFSWLNGIVGDESE